MQVEQQRIGLLGQMASVTDQVRAKQIELNLAGLQGTGVTKQQAAAIIELTREYALGITQLKAQTDEITTQSAALRKGLSAGESASFVAFWTRLNQATRDHQILTESDVAAIKKQADALGAATDDAARLAVALQIKSGRDVSLLSPDDISIAQQLKTIYPDVATALDSTEASALRVNAAFSSLSSSIDGDLTSGLADIVNGTKGVKQGFADMATSIINDIEKMIIKLTIVQPLMRGLQAGFSGLGFGNLFGGTSAGAPLNINPAGNLGGLYDTGGFTGPGGKMQPAGIVHKGEYVMDADSTKRLGLPFLNSLRGYADGGAVGVPSVASAGSWGRGAPSVQIINQTSQPASATATQGKNGDITITLRDAVRGVINSDLAGNTGVAKSLKQFSSASKFAGS
jgi:hypothetical protein